MDRGFRWGRRWPAGLLVVLLTGCGGAEAGRVAVSGTVTLDGQPLDQGTLTLLPQGPGPAATGTIQSGTFTIPAREGPTAGAYRVEIHSIRPTGKRVEKPIDPDYAGEATENIIPPQYNVQTTLQIDVTAQGPNTFDFALESRKGRSKGR